MSGKHEATSTLQQGESTMARNCVSVEIYCECEACGKPVDVHYDGTNLYVTPCVTCLEQSYDAGFDNGLSSMGG